MRTLTVIMLVAVIVVSVSTVKAQSKTVRGIVAQITAGPPIRLVILAEGQRTTITLADTVVVQRRDESGKFTATTPGDIRIGDEVIVSLDGDSAIVISILTPRTTQPAPPPPPPIVASPALTEFSIPEETIHTYYNLIFAPLGAHRDVIDARWCQSWRLLSKDTQAQLTSTQFIHALWNTRSLVGRRSMTVGTAVYNDAKTIAKVSVNLRLDSWLAGNLGEQTRIVTLVREENLWRIVLEPDQIADFRQRSRGGAGHQPKCN